MDRLKYCNELNRETFLQSIGFRVISFAYDDVEQRPELCITLLRMVLSTYQSGQPPVSRALLAEKEIIRLAITLARPLRPKDVEQHFEVDHKTAVHMLSKLRTKGWRSLVFAVTEKGFSGTSWLAVFWNTWTNPNKGGLLRNSGILTGKPPSISIVIADNRRLTGKPPVS